MRGLILTAMLACTGPAVAQQGAGPHGPHLVVSGQGQVSAIPDRAELRIGVDADATEPDQAADALAARIGPVIEALLEAGIRAEDVQTGTLSLQPVYSSGQGGEAEQEITGYRAESVLSVEVRRIGEIGALVGAATGAGANRLDGIRFTLGDPQAAEDAALAQAMEDATRKAAILAGAADRGLGPVLSIVEQGGGPGGVMMMQARASDGGIAVAPGEIDIDAAVSVTFALSGP